MGGIGVLLKYSERCQAALSYHDLRPIGNTTAAWQNTHLSEIALSSLAASRVACWRCRCENSRLFYVTISRENGDARLSMVVRARRLSSNSRPSSVTDYGRVFLS